MNCRLLDCSSASIFKVLQRKSWWKCLRVKQLRSGWDTVLLGVSSWFKLFAYGTVVVSGGLRVNPLPSTKVCANNISMNIKLNAQNYYKLLTVRTGSKFEILSTKTVYFIRRTMNKNWFFVSTDEYIDISTMMSQFQFLGIGGRFNFIIQMYGKLVNKLIKV